MYTDVILHVDLIAVFVSFIMMGLCDINVTDCST